MKKHWYFILAALGIIALVVYLASQEEPAPEPVTIDGITYNPDGSYTYQTAGPLGGVNQYTVYPDGSSTVTTITLPGPLATPVTPGTKI